MCHHVEGYSANSTANAVDGDAVPVPHFGVVLSIPQVRNPPLLCRRLRSCAVRCL